MVSKKSRSEVRVNKHRKLRNRFSATAERPRLAVFRSNNHMYAQIIDDTVGTTLVSASTVQKDVKAELEKMINKQVNLNIVEVSNIDLDAKLVAENIAMQLEKRISFRRAMKQCMQKTMKAGALGIKTAVSGRLGGADMARTEFYKEGTIPLQTLRADIDYGFAEADTTYGKIGVKVWIYKGEILPTKKNNVEGGDK